MKYIDADLLRKEIEYLKAVHIGHAAITKETNAVDGLDAALQVIDSLQQEQQEVDLDAEIEKELRLHYNDDQDVYWWNYLKNSFRHFYNLGELNTRKEENK